VDPTPVASKGPAAGHLLLAVTTLVLAVLLVESAGLGADVLPAFAWIAFMPVIAVSIAALARSRNLRCLHMTLFAVVLGSVGMLLGAILDFGRFGLAVLADWCSALPPVGLDTIASRVAPAPWTYLGMLIGCNLGMVLSTATLRPVAVPAAMLMTRLVCCNAGMMLGMILTEALLPASFAGFSGVPGPVRMFIVMVLGMTAGMWGGWWIAELAVRWQARSTRLAALRRTPELRS